jgi:UDP-glucose 4-epimerase
VADRGPGIVILGAGGFIGAHLYATLSALGHDVIGFSRGKPPPWLRAERWVLGDFRDEECLRTLLREGDIIFDLVGTSSPATSNGDPLADLRDSVASRLRFLEILRAIPPRRFVTLSSGGTVYGVTNGAPVDETAPTEPLCAYGVSKLAIEKYTALYAHLHGLDHIVLRVSNAFGEHQHLKRQQGVVAAFVKATVEGRPIEIWGDGSVVRDYVHVADVADALVRCLTVRSPEHRVINIGSGIGRSVLDVAHGIQRLSNRPLNILYRPGRKADVPHVVLDTRRAREVLGWHTTVSWEKGLERTLLWSTKTPDER